NRRACFHHAHAFQVALNRYRTHVAFFLHLDDTNHLSAECSRKYARFTGRFTSCHGQRLIARRTVLSQGKCNDAYLISSSLTSSRNSSPGPCQIGHRHHHSVSSFVAYYSWWLIFFEDSLRLNAITTGLYLSSGPSRRFQGAHQCFAASGVFLL